MFVESPELLSCPFCGAPARLFQNRQADYERGWWWDAECTNDDNCNASVSGFDSQDTAIHAWNRRCNALYTVTWDEVYVAASTVHTEIVISDESAISAVDDLMNSLSFNGMI